jgi:opacity protein-like surface antigen
MVSRNKKGGLLIILVMIVTALSGSIALAGGKVGIYVMHMSPNGSEAENYSAPGWGFGFHAIVPVPQVHNFLAGHIGGEYVNLLRETTEFRDRITQLRIEQQTEQDYFRLYLGGRVGGHGNGFIRPFAGLNFAVVYYSIRTDVVVPDDDDRENEIRQHLRRKEHWVAGYDFSLGADLNFSNTIAIEGGVRYLKSLSLPQQLAEDAVKISPEYFQIYIGAGVSFSWIKKISSEE